MTEIQTGDTVKHLPTGEKWLVAYVKGDDLAWCGWPAGLARLKDCELVEKASPEDREKLLKLMRIMNDKSDSRYRYAMSVESNHD